MNRSVCIVFVVAALFGQAYVATAEQPKVSINKRSAHIEEARGAVEWKGGPSGVEWMAAAKGAALPVGASVRTGKDSHAVIVINGEPESINVELDSESRISIVELSRDAASGRKNTLLSLEIGRVNVKAKSLAKGSAFEIKTPTSVVSPQGSDSSFNVQVEKLE
jgi:hypothetical protein